MGCQGFGVELREVDSTVRVLATGDRRRPGGLMSSRSGSGNSGDRRNVAAVRGGVGRLKVAVDRRGVVSALGAVATSLVGGGGGEVSGTQPFSVVGGRSGERSSGVGRETVLVSGGAGVVSLPGAAASSLKDGSAGAGSDSRPVAAGQGLQRRLGPARRVEVARGISVSPAVPVVAGRGRPRGRPRLGGPARRVVVARGISVAPAVPVLAVGPPVLGPAVPVPVAPAVPVAAGRGRPRGRPRLRGPARRVGVARGISVAPAVPVLGAGPPVLGPAVPVLAVGPPAALGPEAPGPGVLALGGGGAPGLGPARDDGLGEAGLAAAPAGPGLAARPAPRDRAPGFIFGARLLPDVNGRHRTLCVCGEVFFDYHSSTHFKRASCKVVESGVTQRAADDMTLSMSEKDSVWLLCPTCCLPCKNACGLARHKCHAALAAPLPRMVRGFLGAAVAAAQGADPALISVDGPVNAVLIEMARVSPVNGLTVEMLACCDRTVLTVPAAIRGPFEKALLRVCKLMIAVAGVPDFVAKVFLGMVHYCCGAWDGGEGKTERARLRCSLYPYETQDSDWLRFVSACAKPRVRVAGKSLDEVRAASATRMHSSGHTGKAMDRLVGSPPISCSEELWPAVGELFPGPMAGSVPFVPPAGVPPLAPVLCMEDLMTLVQKSDPITAPGIDGWSYGIVQDWCHVDEFRSALLKLVTLLNNGCMGEEVAAGGAESFFGSAARVTKMALIGKKDNGIRPLGLGATVDKLSDRFLQSKSDKAGDIKRAMLSTQLGVCTKGGTEPCVHMYREWLADSDMISYDMSKAFQSMDRPSILREVNKKLKPLYRKAEWSLRPALTFVRMADGSMRSLLVSNGLPQGKVFSGLACGLLVASVAPGVMEQVEALTRIPRALSFGAYVDDIAIRIPVAANRPPALINQIREIVRSGFASVGLVLNDRKEHCVTRNGPCVEILGAHLGDDAAVERALVDAVEKRFLLLTCWNACCRGMPPGTFCGRV